MPRHVISHSSTPLLSTVFAAMVIEYLKPIFPKLFNKIGYLVKLAANLFPPSIPDEFIEIAVIATFFAFCWGVIFSINFAKK